MNVTDHMGNTKYTDEEWKDIQKDYIENSLTHCGMREKYNTSFVDIKKWLYGLKKNKYSKENCRIEALKYKTRTEFDKKSSMYYRVVKKNKWEDLFKHMGKPFSKRKGTGPYVGWTYERLKECVSGFDNITQFKKKHRTAHDFMKTNGYDEEFFPLLERCGRTRIGNIKWSYDKLKELTSEFETRAEFRKKYAPGYKYAKEYGYLDEFFPIRICTIGMKICNTCKEEKELSEYNKRSITSDGLSHRCKICSHIYQRKMRTKTLKEGGVRWSMSLYKKGLKYCSPCDTVKKHSEFGNNKNNIMGLSYSCKLCSRERSKGRVRDHKSDYQKTKERRKNDDLLDLKHKLRQRIYWVFKKSGYQKNQHTRDILGAEWSEVKEYIERKFTYGMTWDNHGEWHIDHIIPLSRATSEKELIELNHHTNLQPLWATTREVNGVVYEGNLNKGTK
jgi:hypothetical protein